MMARINSAALPRVALSRPPAPSPVWRESSLVARPRHSASGTIARQAARKISVCDWGARNSNAIAAGTKMSSHLSMGGGALLPIVPLTDPASHLEMELLSDLVEGDAVGMAACRCAYPLDRLQVRLA